MAQLVLRLRDREMSRVPILSERVTVGRDQTSDLVIDNAGVSRTHAVVTYNSGNGTYYVQDAESQNGITVNGRPAKEAALSYGDIIGIGKFEIEIVQSGDYPAPTPSAADNLPKRNVMRTMQMDANASARIRDEAIARLAAQKGLPPPAKTSAPSSRQTVPEQAPGSDLTEVLKIVGLVLLAVVVIGGGILFVLSR